MLIIVLFLIMFFGVLFVTYMEAEKEDSKKTAEAIKAIVDYIKES